MAQRIKLNRAGMRALLRSPEVAADLERRARNIADAAGPGHRVDVEVGRNRARAAVITSPDGDRHPESAVDRDLIRAFANGGH